MVQIERDESPFGGSQQRKCVPRRSRHGKFRQILDNMRPSFSLDNGGTVSVDRRQILCWADIAEVAELVDALGSGSSGCTPVRVLSLIHISEPTRPY